MVRRKPDARAEAQDCMRPVERELRLIGAHWSWAVVVMVWRGRRRRRSRVGREGGVIIFSFGWFLFVAVVFVCSPLADGVVFLLSFLFPSPLKNFFLVLERRLYGQLQEELEPFFSVVDSGVPLSLSFISFTFFELAPIAIVNPSTASIIPFFDPPMRIAHLLGWE